MGKTILILKDIGKTISILLAILAVCAAGMSVKWYVEQPSADAYEDMGTDVFYPVNVYPVQVENTMAAGRYKRMNPTKTVYQVFYQSVSGYKWRMEVGSKEEGQKIVGAAEPVERRVLRLKDKKKYFTIPAEDTADSYVQKNRRSYLGRFAVSILYLAIWGGVMLWRRNT